MGMEERERERELLAIYVIIFTEIDFIIIASHQMFPICAKQFQVLIALSLSISSLFASPLLSRMEWYQKLANSMSFLNFIYKAYMLLCTLSLDPLKEVRIFLFTNEEIEHQKD